MHSLIDNKIDMEKPFYIGIGCRRCASSWLHKLMSQHPEIGKPERGLHFFTENYNKGLGWYLDYFQDFKNNKVFVESSVSYLYPKINVIAAKRIKSNFTNVKIFLTLRNPVERAYSDYLRSLRFCEIPNNLDFSNAIKLYPEILLRGKYKELLTPYYDLFGKEKIKLILFDDIKNNPDMLMKDLGVYFGVDQEVFLSISKKSQNVAINKPNSLLLNKILRKTKSTADYLFSNKFLKNKWEAFKQSKEHSWRKINLMNSKFVSMSREDKIFLSDYYTEDIEFVESILDRKLDWYE